MARFTFPTWLGVWRFALQQHLKALTSRTALSAVCVTDRQYRPPPFELLPDTDKTQQKSRISVLQLAHGSTGRLLAVTVREEIPAEVGVVCKPRGVLCCLTVCASNSQTTD